MTGTLRRGTSRPPYYLGGQRCGQADTVHVPIDAGLVITTAVTNAAGWLDTFGSRQ